MKTSRRYRLRRSFFSLAGWPIRVLVPCVLFVGFGVGFRVGVHFIGAPVTLIALFSALAAVMAWPVRILDITRGALRFRKRGLPPGVTYGRARTTRLQRLEWHEVVEVLLASDHGRDRLSVGYRDPYAGLVAAVVDLPEGGAPAVAEAIRRLAPGAVVRQASLADILVRTREPYVPRRWKPRTLLLARVFAALGGIGAYLVLSYAPHPFSPVSFMPLWFFPLFVENWFDAREMVITAEWISVGGWLGRRKLPWATISEARLTATGDGAELTVVTGERTVTYPLPERSDLGVLEAIIRAYAPPNALNRPAPGQVGCGS